MRATSILQSDAVTKLLRAENNYSYSRPSNSSNSNFNTNNSTSASLLDVKEQESNDDDEDEGSITFPLHEVIREEPPPGRYNSPQQQQQQQSNPQSSQSTPLILTDDEAFDPSVKNIRGQLHALRRKSNRRIRYAYDTSDDEDNDADDDVSSLESLTFVSSQLQAVKQDKKRASRRSPNTCIHNRRTYIKRIRSDGTHSPPLGSMSPPPRGTTETLKLQDSLGSMSSSWSRTSMKRMRSADSSLDGDSSSKMPPRRGSTQALRLQDSMSQEDLLSLNSSSRRTSTRIRTDSDSSPLPSQVPPTRDDTSDEDSIIRSAEDDDNDDEDCDLGLVIAAGAVTTGVAGANMRDLLRANQLASAKTTGSNDSGRRMSLVPPKLVPIEDVEPAAKDAATDIEAKKPNDIEYVSDGDWSDLSEEEEKEEEKESKGKALWAKTAAVVAGAGAVGYMLAKQMNRDDDIDDGGVDVNNFNDVSGGVQADPSSMAMQPDVSQAVQLAPQPPVPTAAPTAPAPVAPTAPPAPVVSPAE